MVIANQLIAAMRGSSTAADDVLPSIEPSSADAPVIDRPAIEPAAAKASIAKDDPKGKGKLIQGPTKPLAGIMRPGKQNLFIKDVMDCARPKMLGRKKLYDEEQAQLAESSKARERLCQAETKQTGGD